MAIIYYIHKGIAGFSAVLAITVLVVCTWTFCSIIYRIDPENESHEKNEGLVISYGASESTGLRYETEDESPRIDIRFRPAILGYPTTTPKPEKFLRAPKNSTSKFQNETGHAHLATFDRITESFEKIIIGCVWVSNISAILQFCSCLFILCSSTLKMPQRAKYFVAIHFLVFIILIATFAIPGAYNREEDEFYNMTGFNKKVKNSIGGFSRNLKHFLNFDLNSYYTFLAVDISFLFIFMVSICCLMRYEMVSYDSV